jgi:hypothetical protein
MTDYKIETNLKEIDKMKEENQDLEIEKALIIKEMIVGIDLKIEKEDMIIEEEIIEDELIR